MDALAQVMLGAQSRTGKAEAQPVGTYIGKLEKINGGKAWFTVPSWDRGTHLFGPVRYSGEVLTGADVGDACVVLLPGGDQEPWILGWREA